MAILCGSVAIIAVWFLFRVSFWGGRDVERCYRLPSYDQLLVCFDVVELWMTLEATVDSMARLPTAACGARFCLGSVSRVSVVCCSRVFRASASRRVVCYRDWSSYNTIYQESSGVFLFVASLFGCHYLDSYQGTGRRSCSRKLELARTF